jgi:hypothetical protein
METEQQRLTDFTGYHRANGEPIGFDEPLRLKDAVQIVYRGALGVSALKAEAAKGHLRIEKTANKDFVTIRAINRMREMCRVQNNRPALYSNDKKPEIDTGISDTTTGNTQQAATRMMLSALKENMPSS